MTFLFSFFSFARAKEKNQKKSTPDFPACRQAGMR
jgi:hypothetical protein